MLRATELDAAATESTLEAMCSSPPRLSQPVAHGAASPAMALRFGGRKYKPVDWSPAGCRISAAPGQFKRRQQVNGRIRLAGADGPGEFVAEVLHVDAEGCVALRWLEISPHIFVAMHGLS